MQVAAQDRPMTGGQFKDLLRVAVPMIMAGNLQPVALLSFYTEQNSRGALHRVKEEWDGWFREYQGCIQARPMDEARLRNEIDRANIRAKQVLETSPAFQQVLLSCDSTFL